MAELWKDIPGYEGIYQASTLGNIRTCEDKTTHTERHGIRHWKQRTLKQKKCRNSKGRIDARVSLWKDGKERTWLVSRLVGLTWCDGYSEGLTINHIDGNPLNNSAENLEWISLADNIRHAFRTGLASNLKHTTLIQEFGDGVLEFDSEAEACRFLGRSKGYINLCVKHGRSAINISGEKFFITLH